jgi:hypothetical protein
MRCAKLAEQAFDAPKRKIDPLGMEWGETREDRVLLIHAFVPAWDGAQKKRG